MTTNLNDRAISIENYIAEPVINSSNSQQSTGSNTINGISTPAIPTSSNFNITITKSPNKSGRNTSAENQARKRTKASRACDQCRKKKIKCDYNDLKGICQYCQRNNEECSFVRVPLKRGPSKGYNKSYKNNNKSNTTTTANTSMATSNSLQLNKNANIISNGNINNSAVSQAVPIATNNVPSTFQSFNQVLLPPLTQYIPQTSTPTVTKNNTTVPPRTNNAELTNITSDAKGRGSSLSASNHTGQPNLALNLGQQQFWKVPYHEFPHQKRGSVDSLTSDLSMRNINIQEQLLLSTTQPVTQSNNQLAANFNNNTQNNPSSAFDNNRNKTSNNNMLGFTTGSVEEGRVNSIAGSNNSAYWPYLKNFNPTAVNGEQDIPFRRSSSIPSLLRQSSNSIPTQQQLPQPTMSQLPPAYPYSQFYQQTTASPQPNINSFGNYATTGYHSRNGSVTSDSMSPSAVTHPLERLVTPPKPDNNSTEAPLIHNEKFIAKSTSVTPFVTRKPSTSVSTTTQSPKAGSSSYAINPQKDESGVPINREQKRENSVISINSLIDSTYNHTNQIKDSTNTNDNDRDNENLNVRSLSIKNSEQKRPTAGSDIASSNTIGTFAGNIVSSSVVYGQINDVDLIDLYYEYIHTGFPIIPLDKQTLTNDILIVNIQPISSIHELNNYVILWFRNSLELLIRLAVKRGKCCSLFDSRQSSSVSKNNNNTASTAGTPGTDQFDTKNDKFSNANENLGRNDSFEIQTIFISALNECFQRIVDIHPKFRENKDLISPKIKVIYLCTFIILNYILSYVGYDNSFVLGMSVTIFNEFKLYKMLLSNEVSSNVRTADTTNGSELDYSIVFKRLYILLIIFDSLQSCMFGGPKLLNIPIKGTIDKFFDSSVDTEFSKNHDTTFIEKWCVERDPVKLNYIIQSLNLGEFLTELSINRKSINGFEIKKYDIESLKWYSKRPCANDQEELVSINRLFFKILLSKLNLTNNLISLDGKSPETVKLPKEAIIETTDILTTLISEILQLLTLMLRLNSTNSISPDNTPLNLDDHDQESSPVLAANTPKNSNDFCHKLLGLHKNKNGYAADTSELGIISPFAIPIIYELHNIIKIINKLPTHLISVVMQAEFNDTIKLREIVVSLSNSSNEVVQITNFFNMIKPFKIFDTNLNERTVGEYTDEDLIMKKRFMPDTASNHDNEIIANLIKTGWKLLDDSEFGWL